MNDVFKPHYKKYTLVFFDDILVYFENAEDHLKHLENPWIHKQIRAFTLKNHHFIIILFIRCNLNYINIVITTTTKHLKDN